MLRQKKLERRIEAVEDAIRAAEAYAARTRQSSVVVYILKADKAWFRVHGSLCEANRRRKSAEAVRCVGMYSFEDARWVPACRAFKIVSQSQVT
jgi:hypothetical protein